MATEMRNWIADNRNAEQPPAYFLQRLYDFDAMLVLMPSRDQPGAYVLGRRKQFGPGLTPAALAGVYTKPDTCMCILNGAVPVCMVFKPVSGSWSPDGLIRTLAARDLWAHGGADKVADMLEAQEDAEKKANLEKARKEIYERSGDGWRSYLARTGQSTIKFHDRFPTKQRSAANGEVAAPRKTAGARRTAGLGSPKPLGWKAKKRVGLTIGRRGTKGKGR